MQYKYRYRKQYKGVALDIKAHDPEELADKVAAAKAKIDEDSIDSTMSVALWAKKWYLTYKLPNLSERTSSDYKTRLNRHFLPSMGEMKISDIRQIHLQKFLNDYASETTIGRVRKMYQMLNQMFKAARANGLIRYNPAEDLIVPKGKPDGHGRALTPYEKKILLKVCEYHPDGPWALTMLYSGLRPGETHRLLGKHIQGRYLYVDGTKTDRSKRYVPAPPIDLPEVGPDEYVFGSSQDNISRKWHRIWREMNIVAGTKVYRNQLQEPYKIPKDCVAYCCRHSFANECRDAEIPYAIIQLILGHAPSGITDTYLHHSEEALDIAVRKLYAFREREKSGKRNKPESLYALQFQRYNRFKKVPLTAESGVRLPYRVPSRKR